MNDGDIRAVLREHLNRKHGSDPTTLVVEEMGLCEGDARVDLAVINGIIHGFEIKSDDDTLKRLPGQQTIYNRVLDRVTLVSTSRHLSALRSMVPRWWGLSTVDFRPKPIVNQVRMARPNSDLDPHAMVKLLWRDEALSLLREKGLHKGMHSKPRDLLWARLVERLSLAELSLRIRDSLRTRKGWR